MNVDEFQRKITIFPRHKQEYRRASFNLLLAIFALRASGIAL